jgi:hypothetical protein
MSETIKVFTSAAVNYWPKVRLLFQSIRRWHPEWETHWAVADRISSDLPRQEEGVDRLIVIDDLGIPGANGWLFKHNVAELSTAIKPFAFRYLMNNAKAGRVLYFDPDIVLFSRLDDLVDEFNNHSILLTPHQTKPENCIEAIIDNEICSLRHGVFNLGFLGIRADDNGFAFIDWWAERLYHFCYESLETHLWTDQKWINFAPIFFDGVRILKDSRFNVAPWNITTRHVAGTFADGFLVDGKPLGFYHFTGFDSGAHKIMAMKYGGDNRAVKALVQWYEEQTKYHTNNQPTKVPWGFSTFDNGEPITQAHRLVYRMRRDLQTAYPNPFSTNAALNDDNCDRARSYYEWFKWRGEAEYPDLVHRAQGTPVGPWEREALARGIQTFDFRRIGKHLHLALMSGTYAWMLMRRVWHLCKTEGFAGIVSRLYCKT